MKNGICPNLNALMSQGTFKTLLSTIPSVTSVALPSFMTGLYPPKLSENSLKKSSRLLNFAALNKKTFWEYCGVLSCIVNLRCTYRPRPFNGLMISGDLYTPSENSGYTFPRKLKHSVKGFHENMERLHRPRDKSNYLQIAIDDTKRKINVFRNLLSIHSPDLALYWDGNSDLVQHYCFSEAKSINHYFMALDRLIGRVYEKSQPENILLLSDHGFDKEPEYTFYLNNWLEKKGYLHLKWGPLRAKFYKMIMQLLSKIVTAHPSISRVVQAKTEAKGSSCFAKSYPSVDYRRTVAQLSRGWWGVDINSEMLQEDEYGAVRNKLIEQLSGLSYFGSRLFREIWTSEDLYGVRAFGTVLPDIYLVTDPRCKLLGGVASNMLTGFRSKEKREGDHYNSRQGFMLAQGEDVVSENPESFSAEIVDIAPTVMSMFSLKIPRSIDGKVLPIFE